MLARHGKTITLTAILLVVVALMSGLTHGKFLSGDNFQSMAFQIPEFGLLSLAMAVTMITGGINLSVVSTAAISGIGSAYLMTHVAHGTTNSWTIGAVIVAAILVSIAISIVCGLFNGFLIATVGITPVLATLGSQMFFDGLSLRFTSGSSISGFPDRFISIGNGSLWIIPIPLIIFAVCVALTALVLNRTPLGFGMFMIGANPIATLFSGIKNSRVLIRTYLFSGVLSGIAAIIMISHYNSAKADYGSSYLLPTVMVAILGGVDIAGGFGSITGIILAVFTLQAISSGLNLLGANNYLLDVIWGSVLVLSMTVYFIGGWYRARKSVRSTCAPRTTVERT